MLGCIRCIKCIWNEFYQNVKGILILGLMWPDTLVQRAFFVMQAYLTDVWKLRFTDAAAIVNVWEGLSLGVFPPMFQFLADKHIGHFRVVVISSIASTVGIGFVTMSVPRGIAHSEGKCELNSCVDHSEKVLFGIGMVLTALGRAGLSVSLSALHDEEITHRCCGIIPCNWLQRCAVNTENYAVYGVGALFISLIKSWKLRFGIPAIFSAFATLWFLCCWCGFKRIGPKKRSPSDEDSVNNNNNNNNNAAHRFKVRKDKAKFGLLMVPVSITFIICGMVSSIGRSYFIEQANHMDHKIGILKVPLVALQLPILVAMICNDMVLRFICKRERRSCIRRTCHVYLPTTGITVGMLLSVLCCVTSAKVEKHRRGSHHLLTVAWLLIQYFLLEGMDSFFRNSIDEFYKDKAPESMENYLHIITNAVYGLGYIFNVLLVYVVGKATGWFQETLDQSRLDQYYWVLAGLSGFNLLVFILLTLRYSASRKLQEEPQEQQEQQDQRGPSHRNSGEGEQQPPSGCWGT